MLIREFWKIPFLRLIIPLITGIVLADYLDINQGFIFIAGLSFIAFAFVYRPFLDHTLSYHRRWIFGSIITVCFFIAGVYLTNRSNQFDKRLIDSQIIAGMVNEPPKAGQNVMKCEILVQEYQINKVWYKSKEKILVSFESDSMATTLAYGDRILLKGNLREIRNAGNPSEFDYQKYLARKHIHYKSFQNTGEWKRIDKNKGNPLFALAYRLSNRMLAIYQENGVEGEEFGLLAALTLGTKDYLSDEIIEAYSDSGAMHVLSVSGLHVGIVYIVLVQILFFLRKKRYLQIIQSVIIILTIWFYALLTGLSPSVNRSAAMITLVILGKVSQKKPSIYNSIASSAFILLLIEPLSLFDVGFQLSYLAVIALVFFQPRIYMLYEPKNWLIDKIWSLTAVSFAAQIGTTVLSIYYFHQFPVYALISNLVVVPLSFVVMVLAIALLFTSFIIPLAKIVGAVLSFSITTLNSSTKFIENLPLSTIEPISINGLESIFLHIAIILLMVYMLTKKQKTLIAALFAFAFGFLFRDVRFVNNRNTNTFTVYNVYKKSACSVIKNGNLDLYADSTLYSDKKGITYLTSNIISNDFITRSNLKKMESFNSQQPEKHTKDLLNYLICMDSLKVVYLQGDFSRFISGNKLKVNYIVLSKNAAMDLEPIQNLFTFDLLIADASVPKWKQEVLKKDCQQMAIPFYNVSESGAFIHKIQNRGF